MSTNDRVLELLRRAVAIMETESAEQSAPTPIRAIRPGDDEQTIEGTLGRFEVVTVGQDQIPLFRGTMKIRTPEGPERWIKFISWRKVAVWCDNNLTIGQAVCAIGRWETKEWTDADGVLHSSSVFSARLVVAA